MEVSFELVHPVNVNVRTVRIVIFSSSSFNIDSLLQVMFFGAVKEICGSISILQRCFAFSVRMKFTTLFKEFMHVNISFVSHIGGDCSCYRSIFSNGFNLLRRKWTTFCTENESMHQRSWKEKNRLSIPNCKTSE